MRRSHLCLSLLLSLTAVSAYAEDKTLSPTVVNSTDKAAEKPADASAATAELSTCTQGKEKRTVELSFGDAKTKLPCQVHYKKVTEKPGDDTIVFEAKHDVAFCQAKKTKFVEKLSGMGWSCKDG